MGVYMNSPSYRCAICGCFRGSLIWGTIDGEERGICGRCFVSAAYLKKPSKWSVFLSKLKKMLRRKTNE